ncbi:hypothetical protein N9V16_06985, partial [SAR116 cluster bacterium]|nr:hypothetical protein [SAR116 cluster bacterium]
MNNLAHNIKYTVLTIFLILFSITVLANDYKPVQDCEDIIFDNPELKVEVSDWGLEFVSIFNRTDIKDIEFINIYIKQNDEFISSGRRIKFKDRSIDLCMSHRTSDRAYLIQKKNVYRILMQDDDVSLVLAMLTVAGCGTACYMSGVYEIVFNLSKPEEKPYLRGRVITDAGFPSDWFMDVLHFDEAFELSKMQ